MFFKVPSRRNKGWTLVEMMVAVGVFSIAGLALSTVFTFSIRSFAALTNYAMLDRENRTAMDKLTSEIRQAKQVTNYTTNGNSSLTIVNGDGVTVTYSFSPTTQQMLRDDGTTTQVLLTNCNLLNFSLYSRSPITNSFDSYPVATNNWQQMVKVVQFTWKTSSSLPSAAIESENVQTARVVIRKQDDGL
jgi:prepilin-type N-terminal cleavage/methylation domain-containing protein